MHLRHFRVTSLWGGGTGDERVKWIKSNKQARNLHGQKMMDVVLWAEEYSSPPWTWRSKIKEQNSAIPVVGVRRDIRREAPGAGKILLSLPSFFYQAFQWFLEKGPDHRPGVSNFFCQGPYRKHSRLCKPGVFATITQLCCCSLKGLRTKAFGSLWLKAAIMNPQWTCMAVFQ